MLQYGKETAILLLLLVMQTVKSSGPSIVIVGAGMSGISAAARLHELGFQDVKILEAKHRIGGRIFTQRYGLSSIELGAQWIHGNSSRNPIYQIAANNDLVDLEAADFWETMMDGFRKNSELEAQTAEKIAQLTLQAYRTNATAGSLGQFISDKVAENYEEVFRASGNNSELVRDLIDWQARGMGIENAADAYDVTYNDGFESFEDGGYNAETKRYYISILNEVKKEIPNSWMHLGVLVKRIIWQSNSSSAVRIALMNGTFIEADHVIITSSLGYLKKHHEQLFEPALPDYKVSSIENIGFGTVNKIYLHYDEPFWNGTDIFEVLFRDGKDYKGRPYEENRTEAPMTNEELANHWMRNIPYFNYIRNQPNLICAWLSGPAAAYMETLPDDVVKDKVYEVLRIATGFNISRPREILRSAWSTDPLTYGSYSYAPARIDHDKIDRTILARPLEIVSELGKVSVPVLFAGEATHENKFSTVHGAYETGKREAERLHQYYQETNTNLITDN